MEAHCKLSGGRGATGEERAIPRELPATAAAGGESADGYLAAAGDGSILITTRRYRDRAGFPSSVMASTTWIVSERSMGGAMKLVESPSVALSWHWPRNDPASG